MMFMGACQPQIEEEFTLKGKQASMTDDGHQPAV